MTETERLLEKIAQAWADQTPVDWAPAEGAAQLTSAQLERLRSLDSVTHALRRMQRTAEAGDGPHTPVLFHWGSLEVREPLGAGAQGDIYLAYDPILAQPVALKLTRASENVPSLMQQLQEVRGLASVRHRNVLSVYGAAEHDGRFGIWTELVDGVTLEQALTETGPFAIDEALAIGRDLALALNAVHARGLIHGDVKPVNVLRERGGRIVLVDFGACRMQRDASSQNSISGTIHYLPPESLRGAATDAGADVYALGVLLYRLLSGRYPYPADTLQDLLHAQAQGRPVPLMRVRADVPDALSSLLARVLDPDPARRVSQPGALIEALGEIARARHPSAAGKRSRARVMLAAALASVVAAGIAWSLYAPTAPGDLALAFGRERDGQLAALPAGATLHPGDLLALTLTLTQSSFVYVLNEDATGQLSALYPLADLDRRNPLPAATLELPGRMHGQPFRWRVSSSSAREEFLVVIAPQAIDEIESALGLAIQASVPAPDEQRGVATLQAQGHPLPHFDGSRLAAIVAQLAQRRDFAQLQLSRFEFAQAD